MMRNSSAPLFEKVDWVSFWVAVLLSFIVYLFTLVPDVDLEFSGVFATSGMYLGVPNPPAYPLWTLYSFLFVHLVPLFNVGWRVALATAVASALACGMIALMVSRIGVMAAENIRGFCELSFKEQTAFRIVCGAVAGVGFGLDGCFWGRAVVGDQWNFNVSLFALVLCLLARWFFVPKDTRYLYLAALTEGLLLSDSQAFLPTALAVPFLLALGSPKLGREIFFLLTVFFCSVMIADHYLNWFDTWLNTSARVCEISASFLVGLLWIIFCIITRGLFSEWKITIPALMLFFAGFIPSLLLPIFSMADPPMNWGYPRTVEGFFHVIERGQYGSFDFTENSSLWLSQWTIYGKIAVEQFGVVYLAAAAIPLLLLHKLSSLVRRWILALTVVWFLVTQLMLMALDISLEKSSYELDELFFSTTHLVLALLGGCGFMIAGVWFTRLARITPLPEPKS